MRKVCRECGTPFEAPGPKHWICSDECRRKRSLAAHAKHYWSKRTKTRVCVACGKPFATTAENRRICGEECRRKHRAAIKRQWKAKSRGARPMNATETTAKYEGTFRWGRQGEADIPVTLSRNGHGWFCDSINGQDWVYGGPFDPFGGWGAQAAKRTALEAVRGFLKAWDANGDEDGCCTTADKLTIRQVKNED